MSDGILQILFSDIINGYSTAENKKYGQFYIKHFNHSEISELEKLKLSYIKEVKDNGIPTQEEKNKEIIKEGYWSEKKDSEIRNTELFIKNLQITKTKLFLESQIAEIKNQIAHEQRRLILLNGDKFKLMGLTAESFSTKKINEYYIYKSLFKDRELKDKLFTNSEFYDLDNNILNELVEIYSKETGELNDKNIKRIALSPFFLNMFVLSLDNPFYFFGKFIVNLSFHQISLFNEGKRFKSLLENSDIKPDPELYSDPDAMLEWLDRRKNAEEMMSKGLKNSQEGGTNIIFGAKKTELKNLGYESLDLKDKASKMGKNTLNMEDLMKISGV